MNFYDMQDRRGQNMDTYLARKRLTMPKPAQGPLSGQARGRVNNASNNTLGAASRGFDAKKLYRDRLNTQNYKAT